MATIHLAGSIVLFLFGGVITIIGLLGLRAGMEAGGILILSGFHYFAIGVVMIAIGVLVAMMSKSE